MAQCVFSIAIANSVGLKKTEKGFFCDIKLSMLLTPYIKDFTEYGFRGDLMLSWIFAGIVFCQDGYGCLNVFIK